MKTRWKILVVLLLLVVAWIASEWTYPDRVRADLEETKRQLRQQGFRFELADFNSSTSPELRARASAIAPGVPFINKSVTWPLTDTPELMMPIGEHSAVVIWRQEKLTDYHLFNSSDLWPQIREQLGLNETSLETSLQAAISGPIRFEPSTAPAPAVSLSSPVDLRRLQTAFALRAMLALRDGDRDVGWTNLLGAICLATEYHAEPMESAFYTRYLNVRTAYESLWNAMQNDGWNETQLAELQHRWESVDLWTNLPESVEYRCAESLDHMETYAKRPIAFVMGPKTMLNASFRTPRTPRYLWMQWQAYVRALQYARFGIYKDEKTLLLFCRDRAAEMHRAIRCPTWAEMRRIPGVANPIPMVTSGPAMPWIWSYQMRTSSNSALPGDTLLNLAAESEARRRVIITALALERHHLRHGDYPHTLSEIDPDILKGPLVDFMDGRPLRYRPSGDGHFLLYSVGLDCVDNGGQLMPPLLSANTPIPGPLYDTKTGTDLVWPLAATPDAIKRFHDEQINLVAERLRSEKEIADAEYWDRTAERQTNIEKGIKQLPSPTTNAPMLRGRPLTDILRSGSESVRVTLPQLLTLTQITTGGEPESVTVELPINYEALTNTGTLALYIDPDPEEDLDEDQQASKCDCIPSTNGGCLLVWHTIYETPGKHLLMAGLDLGTNSDPDSLIMGPLISFTVSNLCQFSPSSATFQPELGVDLHAKLPESNGIYSVEFKSPEGELLRTMSGTTSNGFIKVHWDLEDEHGIARTNDSYDTFWRIALPDSGRSQSLRGP